MASLLSLMCNGRHRHRIKCCPDCVLFFANVLKNTQKLWQKKMWKGSIVIGILLNAMLETVSFWQGCEVFDAHLEQEKKVHTMANIYTRTRSLVHHGKVYVPVRVRVYPTYDHNRAITLCIVFHVNCVFERGAVGNGILPTKKDHFKQRKLTNNNTKQK